MTKTTDKSNLPPQGHCLTRRDFLMAGSGLALGAALPLGCSDENGAVDNNGQNGDPSAQGTPWTGSSPIVDLIETAHLADLNHYGEFVDFGTAARFKYTLGGWMSGWSGDTEMNGVSYTWATKSPCRLYFSIFEPEALTFVIRAKMGGSEVFSVYLNDKPLTRVSFKGNDWAEYVVKAPAETVVAGENYLKFVFRTAEKKIGGVPASFAVDYLRIVPDSAQTPQNGRFDPPHLDRIKQRYKTSNKELPAIILSLPSTLSYYLQVPHSAKLCFAATSVFRGGAEKVPQAELRVRATPVNGGLAQELHASSYGSAWQDQMIDLGALAGKLVRMDFAVSGSAGGRLALGVPSLRMVLPKIEAGKQRRVKNAIVVLIDTLRADKLAAYAKTRVRTPAFDKFVKESALFERCQAPSNWTKPSCATVLTGLHPDSHKARGHASVLGSSSQMISEMLQTNGFATGAFIANGYLAGEFGFNRGWTKYTNFIREQKQTEAEHVFKESLDFIAEHKDKPFFTYIQTIDPHVPYDPPLEDLKLYDAQGYDGPVRPRSTGNLLEEFKRKKVELSARDRRRLVALYDGEVTYHDRYFGHFLDGLNRLGVLDDTMIIVCSDHGEEFFDHDSVGHGHSMHQELLHVPLVMRAPGVVPGNSRFDTEVGLTDIVPTVLAAIGQPIPKGIEGYDLLPVCAKTRFDPLSAAFSSFYSEADERNLSWAVRKGDFKLRMKGPAVTYLYNLAEDPREKIDVDERYPLALRALRISLSQFIAAPQKHRWTSGEVASQVVSRPVAKEKKADVPEDLRKQLQALGYMQ